MLMIQILLQVENWAILDMCKLEESQAKVVVQGFVNIGKENGISFTNEVHRQVAAMRDMDQALASNSQVSAVTSKDMAAQASEEMKDLGFTSQQIL